MIPILVILSIANVNGFIVNTSNGPVQGLQSKYADVNYYSFLGIPYAEAPTGELRFMPPVPKENWSEVYNATQNGPVCPQKTGVYQKDEMDEDCLNLNIYVPYEKSESLKPVQVHIHGGQFNLLSGRNDFQYGPQFFVQNDIIFVTFNYRLGALGFLSVQEYEASGNAGLKDALLALKWIKANIENFGGDPAKITLGGNSAGSAMVHYLILSKQAEDLISGAYLISGSALGYRFHNRHPLEAAYLLTNELGYETLNPTEIVKLLKTVDVFDIVEAESNLGVNNSRNGVRPYQPFVPVVEPPSVHALITESPIKTILDGNYQDVPMLMGFNAQEGINILPAVFKQPELWDKLNGNFELCIPSDIEYPLGSEPSQNLARSIQNMYFNDLPISNSTLTGFINLITDTQFSYSIDSFVRIHKTNRKNTPLFYYVFDFDGELNWSKLRYHLNVAGTSHADELGYLFVTNETEALLPYVDSASSRMVDIMTNLFANFVKYGDPSIVNAGDGRDVEWCDATKNGSYLRLDVNPEVITGNPVVERLSFWYNVYDQYSNYVTNGDRLEPKTIP